MRWTPEMRRRAVQGRGPRLARDTVNAPELHWRGDTVPSERRQLPRISRRTNVSPANGPSCDGPDLMPGSSNGAFAGAGTRGCRGASRKPTACGTPVDPVVRKSWRIPLAVYGWRQAQGCIGHPAFRAPSPQRRAGMPHTSDATGAARTRKCARCLTFESETFESGATRAVPTLLLNREG